MNPTARKQALWKPRARRGNLVVTSFILVVGMAVLVGGTHTMVTNQVNQSIEVKDITLARLQTIYLAEMGLNHVMYAMNKAANVATANPLSGISLANAGDVVSIDFKDKIAMTRSLAGSTATCTVTLTAATATSKSFTCVGTLDMPELPAYSKTVTFSAAYDSTAAPQAWELSSYAIQ